MHNNLDLTWRFIESIQQANRPADVEKCLLDVSSNYGLDTIFGGIVPKGRVSIARMKEQVLFQSLPEEWAQRYYDQGYLFRDPIFHRLQDDQRPFDWQEAYSSCSYPADVALIRGEASEFNLKVGYVVPVSLLEGNVVAVSFGGSRAYLSTEDRSALDFVTNYAVGQVLHLRKNREHPSGSLTPRELDCLLWAAEGKTDWEVSMILGISKSTVVKHLVSARDKLGAVNKAHAIAMALRDKLIR